MKKCPICNYENPSAARFCLSCGAPLSDEKLPEEVILRKELEDARRTIVGLNNTVAELKDSTEKSIEQETMALKVQIAEKEKKISELQAKISKEPTKKVNASPQQTKATSSKIFIVALSVCGVVIVGLLLFIIFRRGENNDVQTLIDVNAGIRQTTENLSIKTGELYGRIDGKAAEQPGKYASLQKEAHEFEAECNKIFNGIRRIKVQCLNKSDETLDASNIENDTCVIKKMDDINAAPAIMDKEAGGVMGDSLRSWMDNFRDMVLKMSVFRTDKKDPNSPVDTTSSFYKRTAAALATPDKIDDGATIPWELGLVRHMPLVGTLALLSKLQSDIRNVEAEVLQQMVADFDGMDIRISSLTGLVSTSKSVVISGSQYEADIFVGARDTTMRPTVYITQTYPYYDSVKQENGTYKYMKLANATYDILPIDNEGRGHYTTSDGPGEHGYGGLIYLTANTGEQWIPYKSSYAVATSSTTISATACNIFYKGLQNPVSVAASGYTDINVSATGGATITQGKVAGYEGEYIVTVPAGSQTKEVTINVSADGKSVGHQTFKVMNVPSPIITIGGYKSGDDVPKAAIKGSPRLDAVLEGGFFPFKDVKYTVTSFTYMKEVRGITSSQVVSGNTIPGDILSDISKKASGSSISFIGIKVSSPSGPRNAPGFAARLK